MNIESIEQLIGLSSLLAGFAASAALRLIAIDKKTRLVSCAAGLYLVAALSLLVPTFINSYALFLWESWPPDVGPQALLVALRSLPGGRFFYVGIMAFLLGTALVGWIRSTAVGVVTTLSALVATVVIIHALRVLAAVVP